MNDSKNKDGGIDDKRKQLSILSSSPTIQAFPGVKKLGKRVTWLDQAYESHEKYKDEEDVVDRGRVKRIKRRRLSPPPRMSGSARMHRSMSPGGRNVGLNYQNTDAFGRDSSSKRNSSQDDDDDTIGFFRRVTASNRFLRRASTIFTSLHVKTLRKTTLAHFVANVLLWSSGAALLTTGMLCFYGEHQIYSLMKVTLSYKAPCYLALACGCACIFLSFFGCLGESYRWRLLIYMSISGLLLFTQLIATFFFFRELSNVDSYFEDIKNTFIHMYEESVSITLNVDTLQQRFQCCGVDGYMDWYHSAYAFGQFSRRHRGRRLPESCCVRMGTPACKTNYTRLFSSSVNRVQGIFTQPCITFMKNWLTKFLTAACGVSCTVEVVLFASISIALFIYIYSYKPSLIPGLSRRGPITFQKALTRVKTRLSIDSTRDEDDDSRHETNSGSQNNQE